MKTVNELNKECVELENLLQQLGESKEFITIKQMETLRDYLKPVDYANTEAIASYYYVYLSVLYNMYLERVEIEFNKTMREHKSDDMKYYNHQRGETKGRRKI